MTKPRRVLSVSDDTHARLLRLAQLHGKSASYLIDRFSTVFRGPVARAHERRRMAALSQQ